jgi:very-short-patch-repair endonuclease
MSAGTAYAPLSALVAVMNNKADFARAANEHWYRIPVRSAPQRVDFARLSRLAFYQTKVFGDEKWAVNYHTEVRDVDRVKRIELLSQERDHPRAQDEYHRLKIGDLERLAKPIPSRRWRRIVFIPTTTEKLFQAEEINDLYHENPLEDELWRHLKRAGIPAERQFYTGKRERIYCLDFAIFCASGNLNVECNGEEWHSDPEVRARDEQRDKDLAHWGWSVLRLTTQDIRKRMRKSLSLIQENIHNLGGLREPPRAAEEQLGFW